MSFTRFRLLVTLELSYYRRCRGCGATVNFAEVPHVRRAADGHWS